MRQQTGAIQEQRIEGIHRQRVKTDDAGQLPHGAWVNVQTGQLFRAAEGHSLVAVQSRLLQEYEKLSDEPYLADEQLRLIASRVGVTPQF